MRGKKQDEYEKKVLNSRLYRSGASFTLSDILGILDISSSYVRSVLFGLVNDGFLRQVDSETCISYSSSSPIRKLLKSRLAGYEPPAAGFERKVNPWIRASVRQERANAVGQ